MLTFRAIGNWSERDVFVAWTNDGRQRIPAVEDQIDRAWAEATERLGDRLFDGPMCRLEECDAAPEALRLWVSPTSYKPFLGTNLTNRHVPAAARANPLGLSVALSTCDEWLMLGRRNAAVAYYPNRVHPIAGALEPSEALNVFDGVRRELAEELHLTGKDIGGIRCLGLIEDAQLRQPELIFAMRTPRTRTDVEAMLDSAEHHACVAVEATSDAVGEATRDPLMTPVAVGTLALWGRLAFGGGWYSSIRSAIEAR
ncbi:MAG TPA: hypothetical protein VGR35_14365 [Tepidisphaeraceae bacterium]|nr:hypothetical protein [Tepidisphaeraceae bacterium]